MDPTETLGLGSAICILTNTPSDSDGCYCLETTGRDFSFSNAYPSVFFPLQHAVSFLYHSFSSELSRRHSKLNFVDKYQAQ